MTMRRNNAGYFIRQGLQGLSSHRFFTFAAIGIIAACLIVTGSVALVAVNLEYNLNQLMAENEILAYVEENYSEEETEKVGETLRDVPQRNRLYLCLPGGCLGQLSGRSGGRHAVY